MIKRRRKYHAGEAARFVTRKSALKKLQLSLRDFRTLCIIKGIYPREPKHRRRAQQGRTGIQTLYLKKDIQFLSHEPVIWKLRDKKVHLRRIKRAKSLKDFSLAKRYSNTIPIVDIDHVIKERYPTFTDALRDLDDCLTLCFMFASMPRRKTVPSYLIALCRRLTVEFMHFVIASRALRAVFVSIKGVYFQAEILGQPITWLVSHNFTFESQSTTDVDFRTITTFVEFFSTVLGFVNYRLYFLMNLYYPPQLLGYNDEDSDFESVDDRVSLSDKVAALNVPLKRSNSVPPDFAQVPEIDRLIGTDNPDLEDRVGEKFDEMAKLKTLFEGFRVFLSREVPRETLVFVLRCFGAQVSWDKTIFPGDCLFSEEDESITHQIVDKPQMKTRYLSRYYVQPQWVFDCVNARKILPVEKYFIGAILPPHLSPFSQEHKTQRYVPPEEKALKDSTFVDVVNVTDSRLNDRLSDDEIDDTKETNVDKKNSETSLRDVSKNMEVKVGRVDKNNKSKERKSVNQMRQLKEKMIRRKYRSLYKSMKRARIGRQKEIKLLKYKRRLHERRQLLEKKAALRAERIAALV